jgi:glutamate-1-semialdehyde 2,1-aminomutase
MTGFRLSKGGAQEVYDVLPDMTTLGKIIGGGMPVGAYGGKKEIMSHVSPKGPVYQAGTLSGNPIAMAAGLAMLHYLNDHPQIYDQLKAVTDRIHQGFGDNVASFGKKYQIHQIGSMISLFFSEEPVFDFKSAARSDTQLFGKYFNAMLERGVYLAPSQFEALFISAAIDESIAEQIIEANRSALEEVLS